MEYTPAVPSFMPDLLNKTVACISCGYGMQLEMDEGMFVGAVGSPRNKTHIVVGYNERLEWCFDCPNCGARLSFGLDTKTGIAWYNIA